MTEAFVVAVAGDGFARAIAARQAAVKMEGSSAEQLGADRDELGELEMILPTRYATAVHRARHGELRASVRAAEAALASLPEVGELASLPRTEQRLRAAWDAWTVAERRVWLRRVLRHVDVAPAPAGSHHRGSDVGARLDPSWKL